MFDKEIARSHRRIVAVAARKRLPAGLCLAIAASILSFHAYAQNDERSGKVVVEATCAKCHATGANGAPKIGDKAAWRKLASQGVSGLTKVALKGIRKMPPHGGNMQLTDTEIKRAVTYMVNQSGGNWIEPTSKKKAPAERTGEQVVKAQCSKCHQTGKGGAPKIGDREAWIPRVKDGFDAVVRSAINGHGGMPARGGMANLTDAEMKNAITYMMNKGYVPEKSK
jgi:cytochrome c5